MENKIESKLESKMENKFEKMYGRIEELLSKKNTEQAEGGENRRRNRDDWNAFEGRGRSRERSESRGEYRNFNGRNYREENSSFNRRPRERSVEGRNQTRNFGGRDYREDNLPSTGQVVGNPSFTGCFYCGSLQHKKYNCPEYKSNWRSGN